MAKQIPDCSRRRLRVAVVEDNPDLRELLIRRIDRSRWLTGLGAYGDAEKALQEIPNTARKHLRSIYCKLENAGGAEIRWAPPASPKHVIAAETVD